MGLANDAPMLVADGMPARIKSQSFLGKGSQHTFTVQYNESAIAGTKRESEIKELRITEVRNPSGIWRDWYTFRNSPSKENMPSSTAAIKMSKQPKVMHVILTLGYAQVEEKVGESWVVGRELPENSIGATTSWADNAVQWPLPSQDEDD